MFDFIGLAIDTGLLLAAAGIASASLALLVWLILRRQKRSKRLVVLAVMLPFATVTYWWVLTALFPGTSLFGDIDQPLPNGFAVQALGKMPDFGNVVSSQNPHANVPGHWIDRAALNGDILCGHFKTETTEDVQEPYFVFDITHDTVRTFPDRPSLEANLGYQTNMVPLPEFLSPAGKELRTLYFRVALIPALFALAILLGLVLRTRFYAPP